MDTLLAFNFVSIAFAFLLVKICEDLRLIHFCFIGVNPCNPRHPCSMLLIFFSCYFVFFCGQRFLFFDLFLIRLNRTFRQIYAMLTTDSLNPNKIKNGINTKIIGREIIYFENVLSTMEIAREQIAGGAKEGAAIFADEQSEGKGRRGRVWTCPAKKGLLTTIVIKPAIESNRFSYLIGIASIAVSETIGHLLDIQTEVKWPNDVTINGKKVCGILTEAHGSWNEPLAFAIGIGINVNLTKSELPQDTAIPATSLEIETGGLIDRNKLAQTLLQSLDSWYLYLKEGQYEFIRKQWKGLCLKYDKEVTINEGTKKHTGRFIDITPGGDLILELESGRQELFRSEHVTGA